MFDREVTGLASIYSFGLMLAFMAVFLAVIHLRVVDPTAHAPCGATCGSATWIPVAVAGFLLSWIVWLLALGTHRAGRVVPPLWLLGGVIVFVIVRRRANLPIFGAWLGRAGASRVGRGALRKRDHRPLQAGRADEAVLATACKLAQPERAKVMYTRGPSRSRAAAMPAEDLASEQLEALCRSFAADYDLEVECRVLPRRSYPMLDAVAAREPREADAGLILIGAVSHP